MATMGQYALHIQCARRITGPGGICVGQRDLYYQAGDPDANQEFGRGQDDWEAPGASRCDERLVLLFRAERVDLK